MTFPAAVSMATLNPFEILGADDNDDPTQLLAAAAAAKQKAEAKKQAAAAATGKGAQPAPAKLPTKPAPPAQAGEFGVRLGGCLDLGFKIGFAPHFEAWITKNIVFWVQF